MVIHTWFHRAVRRFMQPVDYEKANIWKKRLAIAYGLLAWNAFGFIVFQYYQGKGDWAKEGGLETEAEQKMPKAAQFADLLGIKNAKVTRIGKSGEIGHYEIVEGQVKREEELQRMNETEKELMT